MSVIITWITTGLIGNIAANVVCAVGGWTLHQANQWVRGRWLEPSIFAEIQSELQKAFSHAWRDIEERYRRGGQWDLLDKQDQEIVRGRSEWFDSIDGQAQVFPQIADPKAYATSADPADTFSTDFETANAALFEHLETLGVLDGLPPDFERLLKEYLLIRIIAHFVNAIRRNQDLRNVLFFHQIAGLQIGQRLTHDQLDRVIVELERLDEIQSWQTDIYDIIQDLAPKIDRLGSGQQLMSDQMSQLIDAQTAELRELILLHHLPGEDAAHEKEREEQGFHDRIDQARDLIQEDEANAALSLLQKLKTELKNRETSEWLQFRLLTNLGASYLFLGQYDEAASHFERARTHAPEDPKALANVALAALIRGEFERSIDLAKEALAIQPEYPTALSVLVQAMAQAGKFSELDDDTRTSIEKHVEGRRALAIVLIDRGEYRDAEQLLRTTIDLGDGEPQDLALFVEAILAQIQIGRRDDPPLLWDIAPDELRKLQEAESLLDEVINIWTRLGNRRRFHTVLIQRANARAMQGKYDLAQQDCQRILGEDPSHPQALHTSGLLALHSRNLPEAIELLEQCQADPRQKELTRIPLSFAYLESEQPREALRILAQDGDSRTEPGLATRLEELRLFAQAAHMLDDADQVASIINELQNLPEENPLVLEALAYVAMIEDRNTDAVEYLRRALESARGNLKERLTYQLAEVYHREREFEEAVPLYQAVAPINVDSIATRGYLVCLLNSGQWSRAYEISQSVRDGGDAIPIVSEVEARVAEYIGDLEHALALYEQLAVLEPDYAEHPIRVAYILCRQGKQDEAAVFLDGLLTRFRSDPRFLIEAATVFAAAERPAADILDLAYRARRLGMNIPEVNLAYVGLFLKIENDPSLELAPSEVVVDSSVQLTSHRLVIWCTILSGERSERERWEFGIADPVAQALLGHTVGDVVELRAGQLEQLSYEISEIQSKYVRAFQETLLNFGTWFPDHPGLHRFDVVDADFSRIFKIVDLHLALHTEMHDLYKSRQITLEGYAQSVGQSITEAWGTHLRRGERILSSFGTRDEQAYYQEILKSCTAVTIDLLALFTLSLLNRLELLNERFTAVYVPQASIDVLGEDIQRFQQLATDHGVLGREGERYYVAEVPREVTIHNIQVLERILAFARERCRVMPASRALEFDHEQFEQFEMVLGRSSIASILVAEETQTPLFSDDLFLKQVARQAFSVPGLWTRPVLASAAERGFLTAEEYFDSIAELVIANYHFVSVNAEMMMHVLRTSSWTVDSRAETVFGSLRTSDIRIPDAVQIVADVIRGIWAEAIPLFQKQHILDLCLRVLTANRDTEIILRGLQSHLARRFALTEHQLREIEVEISNWVTVHRLLGL